MKASVLLLLPCVTAIRVVPQALPASGAAAGISLATAVSIATTSSFNDAATLSDKLPANANTFR